MPPRSAQCLEWAEGVSGHITLQLHHIPSVFLATRCPLTTKATRPQCCYVTLQLSLNIQGSMSERKTHSPPAAPLWNLFFLVSRTTEKGGTGQWEVWARCFLRAEFGKRWGFLLLKGYGRVTHLQSTTLTERRALRQVGRPWLFQKQEKREHQWSLPWPTDITPRLCKNKKWKESRERQEKPSEAPQCMCAHIVLLCVQTGVNLETTWSVSEDVNLFMTSTLCTLLQNIFT